MHRRKLLAALASLPLLALGSSSAEGAPSASQPPSPSLPPLPPPRLKAVARNDLGTTLVLGLPHAPFAGIRYHDDTVLVFVPEHYRYREDEGIPALVHFHGHHTTAERATAAHELREQLVDSRQNAVLIVPQLAVLAADSSCGRLETPGGLSLLLAGALSHAAEFGHLTLGDSAFPHDAPLGRVCVSAHSGGYHAAACSVHVGGVDVSETYLFDALYAESEIFRDWVLARRGEGAARRHKLVSYFTPGATTERTNRGLLADLERGGVLVAEESSEGDLSRRELSHAGAVFVKTSLAHGDVTWETNALRDVLYASTLPRHLGASWFETADAARPIDRRH